MATRALQQQITPLVTMKLCLETRAGAKENVVLQTDPVNLVHMTEVLERALQEARSQHSRHIQRNIK